MKYCFLTLMIVLVIPAFGQDKPFSQDKTKEINDDCNKGDDQQITYVDCRGSIEGTLAIGTAVDTFQGDEALKYINPQASGDVRLRGFGGIEVAYRLFGDPKDKVMSDKNRLWDPQNLWIYTRVIHGARSSDALCADQQNQQNPACIQKLVPPPSPTDVANQFYFMVRNATSLDGMIGLRWEFWRLQQHTHYPANVYLKAQAGFVSIAGTKGSVLDVHQITVGATVTRSAWQDSYLEFGYGRTDFFSIHKRRRAKFEAQAQYHIGATPLYFFTVGKMDTDIGTGSDAYQTYIGFKLDMKNITHWSDPADQKH